MKTIMKELLFDKDVVKAIKEIKVNDERLYSLLYSGKISMKEYVHAIS